VGENGLRMCRRGGILGGEREGEKECSPSSNTPALIRFILVGVESEGGGGREGGHGGAGWDGGEEVERAEKEDEEEDEGESRGGVREGGEREGVGVGEEEEED
jgi:hypothetical protein